MDTCRFCGQSTGHLGACPMQNRSKSTLASWNVGFFSSIRGISIPDWTLRGYTPTFQLGYAMGKNAREHAVAVLN